MVNLISIMFSFPLFKYKTLYMSVVLSISVLKITIHLNNNFFAGYLVIPVDVGSKTNPTADVHALKTKSTKITPTAKHTSSDVSKHFKVFGNLNILNLHHILYPAQMFFFLK